MERRTLALPAKIESLQSLRFLGAMCITVYHFGGLSGCPFDFSRAVYLFYMISGFVVMLSTRQPEKKKLFLTRRLIRTLPLYWGLTVFTFAAGSLWPGLIGYRPTAEQLIKSLLFIPYGRVTAKGGSAIRPIVGLGHTLQMEMLFYVLFLIAMRLSHKYRGVLAAGFAAAVALIGRLVPAKGPALHFYTNNAYVWASFILGLGLYGVFILIDKKELRIRSPLPVSISASLAAVALAVPAFLEARSVWYCILIYAAVLSAALLWSACGLKSPGLTVRLGNISYSYYLLHYYTVTFAAGFLNIDSIGWKTVPAALAISAVTWGISWVSWYLIENKTAAFLQKRICVPR